MTSTMKKQTGNTGNISMNTSKFKQFELSPEQKQEIREAFDLFDVKSYNLLFVTLKRY
jgi:Ca2+-binding EF-hand superfamily protein